MSSELSSGNGRPTGAISVSNSSTTPLNNGQTFTGTWEKSPADQVMVSCITDSTGTLYFDFSNDKSRVLTFPVNGFHVTSGIHKFQVAVKGGRYFRSRFVNDSGANQTYLELYTYYGDNYVPSNTPLNQTAGIDQSATFVRPSEPQDEIRIGRRTGVTGWTKFGYRESLSSAGGEQTVWETTGNFTPMTSAETFDIAYTLATDGLGTTGALSLLVYYIDADGLPATAVHVLSNTGADVTSFTGLGINRVIVASSGSVNMNTSEITFTSTTGASKQAVIPQLESITQQAIFFCGSNHQAIAKHLWIGALKTSGGSSPKIIVKGYVYNRLTDNRYQIFRADIDTSVENHITVNEPIGYLLTPTDVLWFVADTDKDNTNINVRFSLNEYQQT